MVIGCFSYIFSALIVAFQLKFNGKVNPKSFIDLPDRASSRYFDRNLNYMTAILHFCYAVYLQPCFRGNFAKEYVGH